MIQYDLNKINMIKKSNIYEIDNDILQLLKKYTEMVSSPHYNKTPNFINKKSIILNNNRDKIKIIQDSINKILNKITETNYKKLIIELNELLKELLNQINSIDCQTTVNNIFQDTNNIIFKNFFLSTINIELNINIYYSLNKEFAFIDHYIDKFIIDIKDIYKELIFTKSVCYEEMDKMNKNNTLIKNKIIFLSRLKNRGKINKQLFNEYIIYYQKILTDNLNIIDNKLYCNEISELLLTFLNELDSMDKNDKNENIIINNILLIANSSMNTQSNLSNKIILKHKNIVDKLKLE